MRSAGARRRRPCAGSSTSRDGTKTSEATCARPTSASSVGYVLHFVNGVLFSLCYYAVFAATGHAGWLFGAGLGLAHALFAGTGLVSALLPIVHPRMGRRWTDASSTPVLEPPGWMMRNY